MFGSVVLDIAIGVVFIYLLLSLVVTAACELISAVLSWRAKNLMIGVRHLLNDPNQTKLAKKLYEQPLIKSLYRPGQIPSYIPSRTFAVALLDVIAPSEEMGPNPMAKIKDAIEKL